MVFGMRTRSHEGPLTPSADLNTLEVEIAGWRRELSSLSQQRGELIESSASDDDVTQRAIAALDLRKQRLIWSRVTLTP